MEQHTPKFTIHPRDNKSHIRRLCIFNDQEWALPHPEAKLFASISTIISKSKDSVPTMRRGPIVAIQEQKANKVAADTTHHQENQCSFKQTKKLPSITLVVVPQMACDEKARNNSIT
ncbi:hypothetical protein Nepgr_011591 [Nepenthes gracilis]|uniref:Uncharacterized protein n=1 Tax=Nepenthes gracilis TaxID=150966 RepID=A0AAD3XMG5_NEPGR|nr:hypothetical protein Nepgr_011591 [Nepenthes gracilis]